MRFLFLALIALLAAAESLPAQAKSFQSLINQFVATDSAKPAPPPAEQLAWIKDQIKASQDRLNQLKADNAPPEAIASMEEIIRNQTFGQTALESVIRLQAEQQESRDQAAAKPPADQAALTKAKETAADLRSQLSAAQAEAPLIDQRLQDAFTEIQNAEIAQAQLKDAPSDQQTAAALRLEAAHALVFNLKWQKYLGSLHAEVDEMQLQQLQRSIDLSRLDIQLDSNRAQEALAQVTRDRTEMAGKLAEAQKQLTQLNDQYSKLEEEIKAGTAAKDSSAQLGILKTTLANANQLAIGYDSGLKLLDLQADHWKTVLSLSATTDPSLFQKARATIQRDLDLMTRAKAVVLQRFQDTSKLLNQLTTRTDPGWNQKSLKALLEQQRLVVGERVEMMRSMLQQIESFYAAENKLALEVESRLLDQSFQEKVTVTFKDVWDWLVWAWNFPITKGTNDRYITPGSLVIGLVAMFIVFAIAAKLSRSVSGGVQRRFRTDATKTVLIEKWVYYLALVLLVLTVLNWLNIPLTVFAFLGGALAIGIGFGGQNLMNNFISGIILLFERRVNVGDIVEVDGHTGKVMHLGSRSSRIRKWDGVDVLVPNSYFLEKNVINWTLSDPNHRYDFIVGVAYGSPLEQCQQMFLKILQDNPHVLKDPAPVVLFEAFADSTLNFHFYYWLPVNVPHINTGIVGSELRMRVDAVCREAGVNIAFPQRDVRLITDKPIQVTVREGKMPVE